MFYPNTNIEGSGSGSVSLSGVDLTDAVVRVVAIPNSNQGYIVFNDGATELATLYFTNQSIELIKIPAMTTSITFNLGTNGGINVGVVV